MTGLSVLLTRFFPQLPASTFAAVINGFLLLGFAALNLISGVCTVYYCFAAVLGPAAGAPGGSAPGRAATAQRCWSCFLR